MSIPCEVMKVNSDINFEIKKTTFFSYVYREITALITEVNWEKNLIANTLAKPCY